MYDNNIGRGFSNPYIVATKHFTGTKRNSRRMPFPTVKHHLDDLVKKNDSDLSDIFYQHPGAEASSEVTNQEGATAESLVCSGKLSMPHFLRKGFASQAEFVLVLPEVDQAVETFIIQYAALLDGGRYFKHAPPSLTVSDASGLANAMVEFGFRKMYPREMVLLDRLNIPIACWEPTVGDGMIVTAVSQDVMIRIFEMASPFLKVEPRTARLTFVTGLTPNGLLTHTEELDPSTAKMSHPSFYPWMGGVTAGEYFSDFMSDSANVLLFRGPPGTGKSTLANSGCLALGLSALVVTDANLASDPNFIAKLGEAMAGDAEGDYDILIVEDGDALMRPRSEGNLGLNSILTSTDGLGTKRKFKLLVTTNASSTANIDSALLRPGRCYDIMEFSELTPEQANAVRSDLKMPEYKFKRPVLLTSAINAHIRTMKSAQDNETSIVSPRFPIVKSTRVTKD